MGQQVMERRYKPIPSDTDAAVIEAYNAQDVLVGVASWSNTCQMWFVWLVGSREGVSVIPKQADLKEHFEVQRQAVRTRVLFGEELRNIAMGDAY